jgi:hypothetical protein
LSGQYRILDICIQERASHYINPQGGQAIYDEKLFSDENIDLRFIVMDPQQYEQRNNEFVAYLSIIDALMEIGVDGVRTLLDDFDLIKGSAAIAQVGR